MAIVYQRGWESDTAGSEPAGIDKNSTSFVPIASTSNPYSGVNSCDLEKALGSPTGNHWIFRDTSTIPAGNGDYIITAVFKSPDDVQIRFGPTFRGDNGATDAAYAMMIRASNTRRLSSISGTTETIITTATTTAINTTSFWWIKAYARGSVLKGRFWEDGTAEPTTWDIDTTNTTLGNANKTVGYYFFNGTDNANSTFGDDLTVNSFGGTLPLLGVG